MDHSPLDAPPRDYQPDLLPDEPPKWPGVVGVVSIVLASLGIMCNSCGLLSPVLMQFVPPPPGETAGSMPPELQPSAALIALAGVGLVWAFLLLTAGIMLVLRKPAARPVHLVYGVGGIILAITGTILNWMHVQRGAAWVAANPDSPWAQFHSPIGAYIGLAFGLVLGLIWPLFCLIWFGAVKRSPRDITGGASA